MDKVKLPKEVAVAIESLSKKWGKKAFLNEDYWKSSTHPEIKVIDKYFDPFGRPNVNLEDGFDMLVRALYIGYEVEETPEERVLNYFNLITPKDWEFTGDGNDPVYIERNAIRTVCGMLGHDIKGMSVND